jgi:hypothetical protein
LAHTFYKGADLFGKAKLFLMSVAQLVWAQGMIDDSTLMAAPEVKKAAITHRPN